MKDDQDPCEGCAFNQNKKKRSRDRRNMDMLTHMLVSMLARLDKQLKYLEAMKADQIMEKAIAPTFICKGEGRSSTLQTINEFIDANEKAGLYPSTQGAARTLIFHSDSNGLQSCGAVIPKGNRRLIDADKFYAWLYKNGHSRKGGEPS